MKTALSLYSFGKYIIEKKFDILECLDRTKEMGFDGVEILERYVVGGKYSFSEIKRHADEIGLPIVMYTVDANFLKNEGTQIKEQVEKVKANIDQATLLGAPKMRHDMTWGLSNGKTYGFGFDLLLPTLADICREITEYGEKRGVKTMFENHGHFIQDSYRCEKLLEAVNHPNFGLLLDVANFMVADEDPAVAVGRLARYALHVHAKDFHTKSRLMEYPGRGWSVRRGGNYLRGAILGHGDAGVKQSLQIIKNNGYDDYVSIEFEGIEDNLLGIEMGLENLKKYIG